MFNDNLFAASQITILFNSSFTLCVSSFKFFPDTSELVSSANNIENMIEDTLAISLMYKRNNRGPRTDPCGTPQEIFWKSDLLI